MAHRDATVRTPRATSSFLSGIERFTGALWVSKLYTRTLQTSFKRVTCLSWTDGYLKDDEDHSMGQSVVVWRGIADVAAAQRPNCF